MYFCSFSVSFAVRYGPCPLAGAARHGTVGREVMQLPVDPDCWLARGRHGAAGAGERICVFRLKIAMMSTFSIL